ncbi:hypothetical protein C2845_PM09G19940 [Panicum miliaceum]|uniref:RNase H type-1 domain-containing protein n=1 Tax=Panicum miliaceum TaxID=4540 RepID=A0A3L6S2S2_PANMI|nr:hypothetical protein C2845_PM09G19940 [Panicum miliaceum]
MATCRRAERRRRKRAVCLWAVQGPRPTLAQPRKLQTKQPLTGGRPHDASRGTPGAPVGSRANLACARSSARCTPGRRRGDTRAARSWRPETGTRRWNEELVRDSFVPWDAEAILKIKPDARMMEDTIAWNYKRTGIHSVRSTYRLLKVEQRHEEASVGNESVNNFLPTKKELKWRHVEQEDFCETCGAKGETLFHVAFDCPMARSFWQSAKDLVGITLPALHPVTWTMDLLTPARCLTADAAMIICGVWSLWSGRNARKHGKERWIPGVVVRHIAKMLDDLVCLSTTQEVRTPQPCSRWRRPPEDWLKVNTDASFSAATASGASGVVLRNSRGEVLAAMARAYTNIADVTMAEALVARDGGVDGN